MLPHLYKVNIYIGISYDTQKHRTVFGRIYTKQLSMVIPGEGLGLGKGEVKIDIYYYLTFFWNCMFMSTCIILINKNISKGNNYCFNSDQTSLNLIWRFCVLYH